MIPQEFDAKFLALSKEYSYNIALLQLHAKKLSSWSGFVERRFIYLTTWRQDLFGESCFSHII